jgi:hypothetical protein
MTPHDYKDREIADLRSQLAASLERYDALLAAHVELQRSAMPFAGRKLTVAWSSP